MRKDPLGLPLEIGEGSPPGPAPAVVDLPTPPFPDATAMTALTPSMGGTGRRGPEVAEAEAEAV